MAYLQANVLSAYVFLAPAIVAGVMTLGVMQQIIRAFGRVEGSMQYLLKSWPTIIELMSVYRRLREFEATLNEYGGTYKPSSLVTNYQVDVKVDIGKSK
jgi:peptide/bleomycin uptake transporter